MTRGGEEESVMPLAWSEKEGRYVMVAGATEN